METTDITARILGEIRDEIKGLRGDIDDLRGDVQANGRRIDENSRRIERNTERVDVMADRIVESELPVATGTTELAGAVRKVRDLLADRLELRDRVAVCEHEIGAIKVHVGL